MKAGYSEKRTSGGFTKAQIKKLIEELLTSQVLDTVNMVEKFNYWFQSRNQIWGRYTPNTGQSVIAGPKNMSVIPGIAEFEQLQSNCPWHLWDFVNYPYVPMLLAPLTYANNPYQYQEFDYMPPFMSQPVMNLNYQFKQGDLDNPPAGATPDVVQIDFREFITRALTDADIQKYIQYGFIEDMDDVYFRVHINGQLIVKRISGGWNQGAYVITHIYSTEYPNGTSPDNLGTTKLVESALSATQNREFTRIQISETDSSGTDFLTSEIDCATHWFRMSTIVQLSFVPVAINAATGGAATDIQAQVQPRGGEISLSIETSYKPKMLV